MQRTRSWSLGVNSENFSGQCSKIVISSKTHSTTAVIYFQQQQKTYNQNVEVLINNINQALYLKNKNRMILAFNSKLKRKPSKKTTTHKKKLKWKLKQSRSFEKGTFRCRGAPNRGSRSLCGVESRRCGQRKGVGKEVLGFFLVIS